jgi:hypothetical protein
LQSKNPAAQAAIVHRPPLQEGVAFESVQVPPHAPQLLKSEETPVSQPLAARESQSANPGVQLPTPHWPATHEGVAFGTVHVLPQPPQVPTSAAVFASHPSSKSPLQSAKPGLQLPIVQAPPAQAATALGGRQALPQVPQLATLVAMLTSQPSATVPLQLANPAAQLPTAHWPEVHAGAACGTEQTLPHVPQLAGSLPSAVQEPAQLVCCAPQPAAQAPALHTAVAGQALPHAPQFAPSAARRASQPSAALPLQSAKPALHAAMAH